MAAVERLIKKPKAEVFRRAFIKRRSQVTGLFESSWFDITNDVKSWGKVTSQIDSVRLYQFTFGNVKMVMHNDEGRYNPEDSENSIWYGYLNQQRTLVKIEAGFYERELNANGVWDTVEQPGSVVWDGALWDGDTSLWDESASSIVFTGIVSGDILLSDKNEVALNLKPLTSVFQDYPARNLIEWTTTGVTASRFVELLRDQTDGAGSFVFRPFFGDTTTNWDISTTSVVYSNLNTSGAADVVDKTVWDVLTKLSEAENFVPYITREGMFKFVSRAANTSAVRFEFHGAGNASSQYGGTIKSIDSVGRKLSKYYSRVEVKWAAPDTSTSYEVVEADFEVGPTSNPWILGHRTLKIENLYIPSAAVANSLATAIFNEYSALKKEVAFTTSFIPHLDILDRFSIYYEPVTSSFASLWDNYNWAADTTDTSTDLIWDSSRGDAIYFAGEEFKFLSFEIDLDNFQNRFVARGV